jgi:hypothetical protein
MEQFGVSRQVVSHHIRNLIREGLLVAEGKTRQRTYQLKPIVNEAFPLAVNSDSEEHEVWTQYFAEYFKRFSENTNDICNYGFTEIFNNAIDHSEGSLAVTGYTHLPNKIRLFVSDDGIGIFNKITRDLKLADNREAILELTILSGNLYFSHTVSDDWLIEHREDGVEGTYVRMEIDTRATRTIQETFDKYSGKEYDFGFRRTHVPVLLAKYGEEKLVSRSQAKRILARFDRFDEVLLDFAGVDFIGRAFADELFRVYRLKNPKTKLLWIRANSRIESTIRTIMGGPQSNQLSLNLDGPQSPNNNS